MKKPDDSSNNQRYAAKNRKTGRPKKRVNEILVKFDKEIPDELLIPQMRQMQSPGADLLDPTPSSEKKEREEALHRTQMSEYFSRLLMACELFGVNNDDLQSGGNIVALTKIFGKIFPGLGPLRPLPLELQRSRDILHPENIKILAKAARLHVDNPRVSLATAWAKVERDNNDMVGQARRRNHWSDLQQDPIWAFFKLILERSPQDFAQIIERISSR